LLQLREGRSNELYDIVRFVEMVLFTTYVLSASLSIPICLCHCLCELLGIIFNVSCKDAQDIDDWRFSWKMTIKT